MWFKDILLKKDTLKKYDTLPSPVMNNLSEITKATFLTPTLELNDDEILRNAYKGGFVFLIKTGGHIYNGIEVYDVNSMYPAMMLKLLPISNSIYKKDEIFTNSYWACFLSWYGGVRRIGGSVFVNGGESLEEEGCSVVKCVMGEKKGNGE
ncbi:MULTISPECIES: DNA polymerase [unclassified Bartonella]|uniref:DNA polymerase n=1 Tax=unclassified Bartonella TaxID=2645622 RepID=UPI0035CF033B